MDPKYIILICVAAAVVLLLLLLLILIAKKRSVRTESELLSLSRELIASNASKVEVLLVLAEGDAELCEKLKKLQDELRYLSPSRNEKVKTVDEKISGVLGDLKIALNKKKEDGDKRIEEIRVLIAERSVYER